MLSDADLVGIVPGFSREDELRSSAKLSRLYAHREQRQEQRQQAKVVQQHYYDDPVAWMHDCVNWPADGGPAEYQDEAWALLAEHGRLAMRSLHSAGKSVTDALALLWFSVTRDAVSGGEFDWKVVTTAGAWRQLENFLWPEVRKWARMLNWTRIGRKPFTKYELLRLNLNLNHGSAFSVASDTPALIEGAHADKIFYIFDESKAIRPETFDAAEGALMGGVGTEALALATSTPGEPIGRFYDICTRKRGYEDWATLHVTLERAIAAGRVNPEKIEQRRIQWGENSQLFANRCKGEFHSADEDAVMPLSWVEAAIERWHASHGRALTPLKRVGVDVARSGDDFTILALNHGLRISEFRKYHYAMTDETTGHVCGVLSAHDGSYAVVDTDGLGAGVTDHARGRGFSVEAFHGGMTSERKDRTGELTFYNNRSEAWWRLREALDPMQDGGAVIELPDDDEMLGDLTSPHWKVDEKSRIKVEKKEEVQKRLGRSPDCGDATVYSFWDPPKKRRARMVFAGVEEGVA